MVTGWGRVLVWAINVHWECRLELCNIQANICEIILTLPHCLGWSPTRGSHSQEVAKACVVRYRVSFYTGTGNDVPRLVTNLTDFFDPD